MEKEKRQRKRIFYVVGDFHACGWYRCNVPGCALQELGHNVQLDTRMPFSELPSLDVVIFQRQYSDETFEAIKIARSIGVKTVFEIDDDFWNLHRSNPVYEFWNSPGMLKRIERNIAGADVVTTTTPRLSALLRRFNPNIVILPNMLPWQYWQVKKPKKRKTDPLVLGWAGSRTHFEDLKILGGTIEQLLDEFPNLEFHVAGAEAVPFEKHKRARGLESVDIWEYANLIKGFDIAIAPLLDIHFNRCKSDLKFLEYSMLGIPCVASRVESYADSVKNGENGFLASNNKDWLKYLRRLINDEELRKAIGANAKKFAETRTIEGNIGLWEQAYGID